MLKIFEKLSGIKSVKQMGFGSKKGSKIGLGNSLNLENMKKSFRISSTFSPQKFDATYFSTSKTFKMAELKEDSSIGEKLNENQHQKQSNSNHSESNRSSQKKNEFKRGKGRRVAFILATLILLGLASTGAKLLYDQASEHFWLEDGKNKKKVVILGSGWGAMSVVKEIDVSKYQVIVVSPRNYFLFTPLLPSTTVGTIDTRSIVEPVRAFCKRLGAKGTRYYEAEAYDVDFVNKKIHCRDVSDVKSTTDKFELDYDYLIVSVGSVNNTFGTNGVTENCHFLKEVEDATRIRTKIGDVFETASLPGISKEEKQKLLSFLVVGGGPTGVEFAAELYDFLHTDVAKWYSELIPYVSIKLIHSPDHLLNTYDSKISQYTEDKFKLDRIDVLTNTRVTEVRKGEVDVVFKNEGNRKDVLPYSLCVWSTGISASPFTVTLAQKIPEQVHSKLLITDKHLRVKGVENVFALGDCSTVAQPKLIDTFVNLFRRADSDNDSGLTLDEFRKLIKDIEPDFPQLVAYGKKVDDMFKECDIDGDQKLSEEEFKVLLNKADMKLKNYPATAQVAAQQGQWLGKALNRHNQELSVDKMTSQPFNYRHLGSFAYVGGNSAVADLGTLGKFEGILTWWLWRGVYWTKQISMRNKTLVASNWIQTMIWGRDISRF